MMSTKGAERFFAGAISRHMASERAFFGTSALLFAASAAVTIVWCASMSAMGEMPMPGAAGVGARRTDRGRCGRPYGRLPPAHRVEGASPRLLSGGARARPYAADRRWHG